MHASPIMFQDVQVKDEFSGPERNVFRIQALIIRTCSKPIRLYNNIEWPNKVENKDCCVKRLPMKVKKIYSKYLNDLYSSHI